MIFIQDSWDSVKGVVQFYTSHQDEFQPVAGPGNWNDPDMVNNSFVHVTGHMIYLYSLLLVAMD